MKTIITALLVLIVSTSIAQQKHKTHDYTVIKLSEWVMPNRDGVTYNMDTYNGAKALIIRKNFNDAKFGYVAYPKNINFTDGEIELDMASTTGNDFVGLAFRIKDAHRYQTLYFRPAS